MRKTSYPSRLEPRLRAAILRLDLMSEQDLEEARRRLRRDGGKFMWPEFLAMGPGSFSAPWHPPQPDEFSTWISERCRHYDKDVKVSVSREDRGGTVEFRTPSHVAKEHWARPDQAYERIESAFEAIETSSQLGLALLRLEPRGEEFQWMIVRTSDMPVVEDHLKGEREWHSALSRAYQRFAEATKAGKDADRLEAAREGTEAGERMLGLGADYTFHSRQVAEMYEFLGDDVQAARWYQYPHREHPRGPMSAKAGKAPMSEEGVD